MQRFVFTSVLMALNLISVGAKATENNTDSKIEAGHAPSVAEQQKAVSHNAKANAFQALADNDGDSLKVLRPFAEYELAKYFLMSTLTVNDSNYESKKEILRTLPENVIAVVYTTSSSNLGAMKAKWADILPANRLKFMVLDSRAESFWTRDGLPVPVYVQDEKGGPAQGLVDARYYKSFESDAQVAKAFMSKYLKHDYYFEGGNFQADTKGNCFIVNNSRAALIPDEAFKLFYGCKTLTRFIQTAGIGHVDERIRIIDDSTILTDDETYAPILEKMGYRVIALPRLTNYRSYANALLVNGTLYMPAYGRETDALATDAYRKLGFKVIALDSEEISTRNQGSFHCITMTYPGGAFTDDDKYSGFVKFAH
jgi:agmatine/peptidylarginine deiminase